MNNILILLHRVFDILLDRFLPVFGTVDPGKGWHSQVCPRAIGGINTCHKMRHSLSLLTVRSLVNVDADQKLVRKNSKSRHVHMNCLQKTIR